MLYWGTAGLFAAYAVDVLDIEISLKLPRALLLMQTALVLDEEFQDGSIHDFFISYYASMPVGMGGDPTAARRHFKRAIEVSGGLNPSPYLSLALSLSVKNQDRAEFQELLTAALAIDPDKNPAGRLAAIITQRKARWYLDHIDDFFI